MKRSIRGENQHTWLRGVAVPKLPSLRGLRGRKLGLQFMAVLTTTVFMSACSTAPVSENAESKQATQIGGAQRLLRAIPNSAKTTAQGCAHAAIWYSNASSQLVAKAVNPMQWTSLLFPPSIKNVGGKEVLNLYSIYQENAFNPPLTRIRDALYSAGAIPDAAGFADLNVNSIACPSFGQVMAQLASVNPVAVISDALGKTQYKLQEFGYQAGTAADAAKDALDERLRTLSVQLRGIQDQYGVGAAAAAFLGLGTVMAAPAGALGQFGSGGGATWGPAFERIVPELAKLAGAAISGPAAAAVGVFLAEAAIGISAAVAVAGAAAVLGAYGSAFNDALIAALAAASFTVSMDSVVAGVFGVQKNVEMLVLAAADAVNDASDQPTSGDGSTVTGPAPSAGAGAQVQVQATTSTGEPASVATGGGSGGDDGQPPQKDGNPLVQAVKRVLTYFKCLPQFDLVTCGGAIAITTVIVWPAVDRSLGITKMAGRVYQLFSGGEATPQEGSTVVLTPSITARPATDADLASVGQPTDDELLQDRLDLYCSAEAAVVYSDRLQALNEDACGVFRSMTEQEQSSIIDAVGGAVPCAGYGEIVQNIEEGWSTVCRFLTNVVTAREKMVNYQRAKVDYEKALIELEMKKRENDRQWTESLQNSGDYLAPLLGLLDDGGTITTTVEVPTTQP
jgi:type II secretory pathway pseudopilin PulG